MQRLDDLLHLPNKNEPKADSLYVPILSSAHTPLFVNVSFFGSFVNFLTSCPDAKTDPKVIAKRPTKNCFFVFSVFIRVKHKLYQTTAH